MNILLWIVTVLLALVFVVAGLMKLTLAKPALVQRGQGWAEDLPDTTIKVIGTLEILAAIGLVMPALIDTATILVPLAAVGLVALMIGAVTVHARRREYPNVGVNLVLAILALSIAVQRFVGYAP
jgi:uncharacterized membrane protein YphA (DoxX/SURF4 family)